MPSRLYIHPFFPKKKNVYLQNARRPAEPGPTGRNTVWSSSWEMQQVKEAVNVLVAQLCPTFCNLMGCSPPGSCSWGHKRVRQD